MNKILTVVIPTYNMEKYLEKSLTSLVVEEEFMSSLEVLIVNDGSKDRSSEIGHSFQARYPQTFRVIDKENGNYGSCINVGLKEAQGKYIKILDADDSFDTSNFQKVLAMLNDLDVDMVITNFQTVDEKGTPGKIVSRKIPLNQIIPIEECIDELISHPAVAMHSAMYKTENLQNINYHQTEGISYTDEEWMFLPITTVRTLYYVDIIVYLYLVGREGQTVDISVVSKNWRHNYIGIKNELDERLSLASDVKQIYLNYLDARLYYRLKGLYYVVLILSNERNAPELVELDEKIEKCLPSVYQKLSNNKLHSILPITYVRGWRKMRGTFRQNIYLGALHCIYKFARLVLR